MDSSAIREPRIKRSVKCAREQLARPPLCQQPLSERVDHGRHRKIHSRQLWNNGSVPIGLCYAQAPENAHKAEIHSWYHILNSNSIQFNSLSVTDIISAVGHLLYPIISFSRISRKCLQLNVRIGELHRCSSRGIEFVHPIGAFRRRGGEGEGQKTREPSN